MSPSVPDANLPFAARRVAEIAREMAGNPLYHDIVTLLPVLDAVAAGRDEARLERWARAFAAVDEADYEGWPEVYDAWARAAIALAAAERAAEVVEGWRAYEEARESYRTECIADGGVERDESPEQDASCAALDAAVRRLAGRGAIDAQP